MQAPRGKPRNHRRHTRRQRDNRRRKHTPSIRRRPSSTPHAVKACTLPFFPRIRLPPPSPPRPNRSSARTRPNRSRSWKVPKPTSRRSPRAIPGPAAAAGRGARPLMTQRRGRGWRGSRVLFPLLLPAVGTQERRIRSRPSSAGGLHVRPFAKSCWTDGRRA